MFTRFPDTEALPYFSKFRKFVKSPGNGRMFFTC